MDEPSRLNPIFDYAARGQYWQKHGEWEKAVHWYHRAMACFPNHPGIEKRIRPFTSMNSGPAAFTPQHAGRIYTAVGRCLMEMDRGQDSLLAFQAAISLDPENLAAQRYMRVEEQIPREDASGFDAAGCGYKDKPIAPKGDLRSRMTLVLVTHCPGNLKKFRMLSPPSCKLVTATYGSLLNFFGDEVSRCPKIMGYDANPNGKAREVQYGRSLKAFANQQGFELRRFPGVGLFKVLKRIVATVATPYILFVEHDWLFQGPGIRLNAVIDRMDRDPNMHSVRFNKRDNYINGHDYIMQVPTPQTDIPVLRTAAYSNNPSVIRTAKLKSEWLPLCEQALRRVSGKLGGSAFGIEEILFKHQVESIRQDGFDKAHARWGTFIYGGVGDPPRIVHLGE